MNKIRLGVLGAGSMGKRVTALTGSRLVRDGKIIGNPICYLGSLFTDRAPNQKDFPSWILGTPATANSFLL